MMRRLTALALLAAAFLAAGYGLRARPDRPIQPVAAAAAATDTRPADRRIGLIMVMPGPRGRVVTDDYMFTLYRSDRDSAAPPTSTCTGDCAATWLPALVDRVPTYDGGDRTQVGTVTRPDGSKQLTLRGQPLYRYSGDLAEGDVKGDGIDGSWHAVSP